MNFNLIKCSFATALLFSIISSTGSAFAYKPIQDRYPNPNLKTCSCPQPPSWETKIKKPIYCPDRYCPDFKTSSLQTILQIIEIPEPVTDKTNEMIAGRMEILAMHEVNNS